MLTPEYIDKIPESLEDLTLDLERFLLEDISRRIAKVGNVTDAAEYEILKLKELGAATDYIEKKLAEYTRLSEAEISRLFFDAAQSDNDFYENVYEKSKRDFIPFKDNDYLKQITSAAVKQTLGEINNFTRSLGFVFKDSRGNSYFSTPKEAYTKALDKAFYGVYAGGEDYISAVRKAVKELSDSGIRLVDYSSGVRNHADVAVRRAVLTGINQVTTKISEENAKSLETDIVEVTAHAGARPSHALWQGKRYSLTGKTKGYKLLSAETGYGTGEGLCGWNCRHSFYPFIPGISVPAYTSEELKNIDPAPVTIDGRTYTCYEATQRQRQIERAMRKTKRELIGADASGDEELFTEKSVLLRRQTAEYKRFSKLAGLPAQPERYGVVGYGRCISGKAVWSAKKKGLTSKGNGGIMKTEVESDLGKFKKKMLSDQNFKGNDEYYGVLKTKFSHGTKLGKKAFAKFVPTDTIENSNYEGIAHYDTNTKKISMHFKADLHNERGAGATWFHEHGHLIDDMAGNLSDDKDFLDLLKTDVVNYRLSISKKYNLKTYDKVDKKISSELSSMRKHSAVSDMLEGLTKGNIQGCAGHGQSYWNDISITSEAFAHMYQAQFDSVRYEEMKKIFPSSLSYFESKLKEAIK